MIVSFKNKGSKDIAYNNESKEAGRLLPLYLHTKTQRWLAILDATSSLDSLANPGLRLEKLSGDKKGLWSIRINNQYRICFSWKDGNCYGVEIIDYH
jgi:toxin HigB-1